MIKDEARNSYAGPLTDANGVELTDDEFVNMMTLDGWVIVEIITMINIAQEQEATDWSIVVPILPEMLLLENQIPFIVLDKIWNFQRSSGRLVDFFLWQMRSKYSGTPDDGFFISETPLHLVDLLGLVMFPNPYPLQDADHLSIPCLSELHGRGIDLKKSQRGKGLKVSFFKGLMSMNPLNITKYTDTHIRNLIAFEQCYEKARVNASSYVVLMNSLIQTSLDAAILSLDEKGILTRENANDHADIVHLFKTLREGVYNFKVDPDCNPRIVEWIKKREGSWENSPKIFIVPAHIRHVKPSAYEPTVISFGPYHHGKERLKAMEHVKWWYRDDLLERYQNKNWTGCLEAVRAMKDQARGYNEEPLGFRDREFVQMMALDGCFHVELRHKLGIREHRAKVDWTIVSLIQKDMMLLENQIPFIILEEVWKFFDCRHNDLGISLKDNFIWFIRDLYSPKPDLEFPVPQIPCHLIDLLHLEMFPPPNRVLCSEDEPNYNVSCIPRLFELQKQGVKFRKQEARGLQVSFENGTMIINCHKINSSTDCILQNLIAFEQCYWQAGTEASSYVVLLNNLIRMSEDVVILSSRNTNILINRLTSEEEVINLFKSLCRGIDIFNGPKFCEEVTVYRCSRPRQWMKELLQDYFSSPWSFMAAFTAGSILGLTAVQTAYTIKSLYNN